MEPKSIKQEQVIKTKGYNSPCLFGFSAQILSLPYFLSFSKFKMCFHGCFPQNSYLNCIQSVIQLFSFVLFMVYLRLFIEDSKIEVHLHRTKVILLIF